MATPPPPPGFTVDQSSSGPPPPPPGFTVDSADPKTSDGPDWEWNITKNLDPTPFFKAIPQGVLGIPEAAYQYAEHVAPNVFPHPGQWADPLRRYRDESDSTWRGLLGETLGGVGAFSGLGALAEAIPGVSSAARSVISSPGARRWLSTILQSQVAQPTSGSDFWEQKAESAVLAHLLDRWLGRPRAQAEHNVATKTNEQIEAANKAAADSTAQANKDAREAWRDTAQTQKDQHQALSDAQEQYWQQQREAEQRAAKAAETGNKQAKERWEDTADTLKEQHAALTEAQRQFHGGERAKAQAAADALTGRTNEALAAQQAQVTARS